VPAVTLLVGRGEGRASRGRGRGRDAPLRFVVPGSDGCLSLAPRMAAGLVPPGPTAKDAESQVQPLPRYLHVKTRYPQSTKERHYLPLIDGEVPRVSQKCMRRHIYPPWGRGEPDTAAGLEASRPHTRCSACKKPL